MTAREVALKILYKIEEQNNNEINEELLENIDTNNRNTILKMLLNQSKWIELTSPPPLTLTKSLGKDLENYRLYYKRSMMEASFSRTVFASLTRFSSSFRASSSSDTAKICAASKAALPPPSMATVATGIPVGIPAHTVQ